MNRSEAGKIGYLKSKEKLDELFTKRKDLYYKNPKKCLECNKDIEYEKRKNKFCNHSCAACHNNKGIRRNGSEPGYCLNNCGEKLLSNKKTYCSSKCFHEYKWNLKKEEIRKNPNEHHSSSIKKFLLEERGHKCEICKNIKWMKKDIPLEMDHIDGNHQNNSFENIRLICPNCHAQTPTYKGKNKGSGRHFRKERYKEGKSF